MKKAFYPMPITPNLGNGIFLFLTRDHIVIWCFVYFKYLYGYGNLWLKVYNLGYASTNIYAIAHAVERGY